MPRRTTTKKTTAKKTKIIPVAKKKLSRKDMRFSVSLVILIGMLTFSLMLLLFSLNKSATVSAKTEAKEAPQHFTDSWPKKPNGQILNDKSLDFNITIPAELGQWLYKTGEVKSLTDDSLSDQYLRIFVPVPGDRSNNFDQQNKEIMTIRKVSSDEWSDAQKGCQKGKQDICDAAGKMIANGPDSQGDGWVYTYLKPADCPKNIEAKCNLADKIIESFNLK